MKYKMGSNKDKLIPADWKWAGQNEEQLSWVLFDVQSSTTSANTVLNFLSRSEAAQNERVTNMPLAGQLPATQRFLCHRIELMGDAEFANATDVADAFDGGSVEITINRKRMIQGPLRLFLGTGNQFPPGVTNVVESFSENKGVELDPPLIIPGATELNCRVVTGDTTPTAAQFITVSLIGVLVRPRG